MPVSVGGAVLKAICIVLLLSCTVVVVSFSSHPPTQRRRAPIKAENTPIKAEDIEPTKEKWILVVEDEEDLRSAIGEYLAKEGGYYVTGVVDARSAILVCGGIVQPSSRRSRFKFNPDFNHSTNNIDTQQHIVVPDCLVLDIRLGSSNMDGIDALISETLPVVLLTAKGKVEDCYKAGADAYLAKPFDPEELLTIVNGLLTDKVSISGQSNDSYASNETYRDLKHELGEIKALLNGLERPSTLKPDDSEMQASTNSLKRDILEVKEKIKGSVNQIVADSAPPQSTVEIVPDHFITSVLTPEETAIMVLVAKGMTNKQIAIEMECSESKIQKHMTAMFKKAEVNNRAELVVWWGEYLQDNNAADTNEIARKAATLVKRKSKDKPNPSLTGKDKVVLDFLVGGMTIDEIASKTNSSKGRVSKQLGKLFQIANVNSRTDLLNWWSKTGNAS